MNDIYLNCTYARARVCVCVCVCVCIHTHTPRMCNLIVVSNICVIYQYKIFQIFEDFFQFFQLSIKCLTKHVFCKIVYHI